ncbi:MAG: deoxyribodipyrimidine photo-lyase [Steroidobacteraceae bacterium]|jgi:deoxyribodipyrimidine photo-lyase|nr:deoxyribodipyrimidine photo-lyase [Steroidobacteraceae bacterium]
MSTALVWFRRDLRLADHPALEAALAEHAHVVPVYVHSPDEDGEWRAGAASRWWLHHSLAALDASLRERGSRLVILRGPVLDALAGLARATGARAVRWNRVYDPGGIARDKRVKEALREQGLAVDSTNGSLLFEPWTVKTGAGDPYRVFTPFWRSCQRELGSRPPPRPAPLRLPLPAGAPDGLPLAALELLPRVRWDAGLAAAWQPGEAGAAARLGAFCDAGLADYPEGRDRPARSATSRLSPHLHFGELSPRQALAAASAAAAGTTGAGVAAGVESFLRELGWREFAHHLLFHYPHTLAGPMDARFAALPWRDDASALEAWQRGRTGYPIVDAGMRELWHTGWMHNRVRMIVASLLTKNLGVHWLEGQRWFHDTLVDADLANNALGWQWVAGCGADAAPYYRIFNPMLQTERFDPERAYVRRWVPELARVPDKWIHQPWAAPADVLSRAGVRLGTDYPAPVVEFKASRDRALETFRQLRGDAANPAVERPRKSSTSPMRLRKA